LFQNVASVFKNTAGKTSVFAKYRAIIAVVGRADCFSYAVIKLYII